MVIIRNLLTTEVRLFRLKEAMINAILEEFILIKLHKKLLTAGNSWLTVAIRLSTMIRDLSKLNNN